MMLLVVSGLILMFLIWLGRDKPVLTRGEWRMGAGLTSIAGVVAAAFLAIRGQWEISLALVAISMALLFAARSQRGMLAWSWRGRSTAQGRRQPPPGRAPDRSGLSLDEARAVLGVSESATVAEIRKAYARLMRLAHPDHGGTSGLAAQLNAARDRLLKS